MIAGYPYDYQFGFPHVAGRRFENGAILETHQIFNHDNANTTDETKIANTKFVLRFATDNCAFVWLMQIRAQRLFHLHVAEQVMLNNKGQEAILHH